MGSTICSGWPAAAEVVQNNVLSNVPCRPSDRKAEFDLGNGARGNQVAGKQEEREK